MIQALAQLLLFFIVQFSNTATAQIQDGFTSNTTNLAPIKLPSKIALVIGNSAYQNSPRASAKSEASEFNSLLISSGFATAFIADASRESMIASFRESIAKADATTEFVFVFFGRAVQSNGKNYLLSVSDDSKNEADIPIQNLDLSLIFGGIERAKLRSSLIVIDAAYREPFGSNFLPLREGLADVRAPSNTFLAFSASPGKWVSASPSLPSVFAQQLLRILNVGSSGVEQLFRQVRDSVSRITSGLQVPWDLTSLRSRLLLGRNQVQNIDSGPVMSPQQLEAIGELSADRILWDSVLETARSEDFALYLARFPNGVFSALAKRKLIELPSRATDRGTEQESFTLSNGGRYKGSMRNLLPQGQGELIMPDGSIYIGQFNVGKRSGKGRIVWKNKEIYVGEFTDDTPNGFGSINYSNGDHYSGNFVMGALQGKGRYESASNGSIFFGEFIGGKRIGIGKLTLPDGSEYEGFFQNGVLNGIGSFVNTNQLTSYNGEFSSGIFNGAGVLIDLKNGIKISGHFKDGMANGFASMQRTNNPPTATQPSLPPIFREVYSGEFLDGIPHGQGVFIFSDTSSYTGSVEQGTPNGMGKIVFANSSVYEGAVSSGQPHGEGKLIYPDKTWHHGLFVNGKPMGLGSRLVPEFGLLVGTFKDNEFQGTITRPNSEVQKVTIQNNQMQVIPE